MTRSEWARECMRLRSRIVELDCILDFERETASKDRLDALEAEISDCVAKLDELYLWDVKGR